MDFSYQTTAADKVLENALSNDFIASILAACPGSGKTTISHIILNNYFQMFPQAKVVVLTEGQSTLTNQYLEELKDPNVGINFSFGSFGSGAQVEIGIPQGIDKVSYDTIDLLIVDEAHNYYLAPMVQDIVRAIRPKHKILMTGSPTKYNKHNQDSLLNYLEDLSLYGMYYISAEDLIEKGVFSSVDLDVCEIHSKKDPINVIESTIIHATKQKYDLSKIMIACPTIEFAKKVSDFMTSIGREVSLSTSKNDKEDKEIRKFKSGESDVLVVVGKGILGFNDKMITSLFDFRSSENLDSSYQLFARVLRTHPKDVRKAYIRVGTKDNFKDQVLTIHKIHALMRRENYIGFTGKNLEVI